MQITKEQAQIELAKRELSLRMLSYFVPQVDPYYGHESKAYIFKPFHKIMTDALEKALSGGSKRIMISVPPQHGKSTISTQRFPLFAHLQDPTLNIVSASYSGDLAKSHLSKIRQIVESPQFAVLGKPMNFIKNDSQEYILKEGGSYYSVGVGGGLTGRPVDIAIIDDVHKNRSEYESDTIRKGIEDWYSSVLLSRLHKDSIIIGVMTRWGEDDLFGRILETEGEIKNGGIWEVINIPVYNETETETIFPERFPIEFMKTKERAMIPRDFQSLYMGDPVNEGGGAFKKEYFQYYDNAPKFSRKYSFIDPAISQKQEADYTAIITIGVTNDNKIYILDIFRERALPDEIINNAIRIAQEYNVDAIGVETIAYQKMLALELKKQMILRNKMFRVLEMKPSGEKEARIKSILQTRYALHTIYHKRFMKNIDELELELLKFPNGKHDDMIDSLASAINIANIEYVPVEIQPTDDEDDPLGLFKENADEVSIDLNPY